MRKRMNHSLSGLAYFLDGFSLITKPGLRRYVIIPLFINLIFFIGLFLLLRYLMHDFNQWVSGFLPSYLQWLSYIFWVLFFSAFFIFFIYSFLTIANIIAAP